MVVFAFCWPDRVEFFTGSVMPTTGIYRNQYRLVSQSTRDPIENSSQTTRGNCHKVPVEKISDPQVFVNRRRHKVPVRVARAVILILGRHKVPVRSLNSLFLEGLIPSGVTKYP